MQIKQGRMGPLNTNCYLVWDDESLAGMLIDPAGKPQPLEDLLADFPGEVKYIVCTHGHPDHVAGLEAARQLTGAPILIHETDVSWLAETDNPILRYMGISGPLPEPDVLLHGGEELQLGPLKFTVLLTPGHTEGGISLWGEGVLFSGDTLFAGSYGRYDLPGGDFSVLKKSLEKLLALPPETRVYPGHNESTTIAREREDNMFIRDQRR